LPTFKYSLSHTIHKPPTATAPSPPFRIISKRTRTTATRNQPTHQRRKRYPLISSKSSPPFQAWPPTVQITNIRDPHSASQSPFSQSSFSGAIHSFSHSASSFTIPHSSWEHSSSRV